MKTDPQAYDPTLEGSAASAEAEAESSARTVDDLLSTFSMKGSVIIPREMRVGMVIVSIVLTLTLLLGTLVLVIGGSTFFTSRPAGPGLDAETEGTARPEGGDPAADYPFADGKAGEAMLGESGTAVDISLIGSTHAVVADASSGTVLASCLGDEPMYPASMTKVMTLIVVVERLPYATSLQDTITISQEVYDRMVAEGSSGFGFKPGMKLSVEALLYALVLQSDGIAAGELARYIAGSEAAFVELMN